MRVLWFTNIVLPEFAVCLNLAKINQCGWLQALVKAIRIYAPQIELHICSPGPEDRHEVVDGVSYYSIGSEYNGRFLHRPSRKLAQNVSSLLKTIHPEIVHFHGSEGLFGTVPREVYAGVKSVVSMQGILQGCYPHYTGGINEIEARKYRNYLNAVLTGYTITRGAENWRIRQGERERIALTWAENIIGRTAWDYAWSKYLAPQAQYFHVGEVLRPEFYCGRRSEKGIRRHSIFCGGAMAYPLKGGHWLLRAIAALKRDYPNVQLRVANAERIRPKKTVKSWLRRNEYQRYLWRIIEENGLQDNIVLMPSLTAEQIVEELRNAEVFCLPSMCENSPNSIGEAMLIGVPIIATNVGGISSIVDNGKEGLLVPSGDPAVLAAGISQFFSEPDWARMLADNAFATAKNRYGSECVVRQLLETYETICGKEH